MELEKIILGSMILSGNAIRALIVGITTDVFCDPANKIIFRHIKKLTTEGGDLDLVTLRDSMLESGEFETAGGVKHMVSIAESGIFIEGK